MPFETADLLPRSTQVPGPLETDGVTIRQLTVADAERDFDAVTESRDRIRGTFGPETDWPPEDLTLEQNRIDVAWHQKEHQRRDAFTYAVVDPSDTTEYGCLYVQPTRNPAYEATVYFWIAESAVEGGRSPVIESTLREWIEEAWPFETVAYPGRDEPWTAFNTT